MKFRITFLIVAILSFLFIVNCNEESSTEPEDFVPPTLSSPANTEKSIVIPPTLVWNVSSNTTSYTLQVSINITFNSFVFNDNIGNVTSKELLGLNNATTYYWRISATNNEATSAWSSVWNFTTIVPCPGIPTVNYGGKTYNTIQIGNQCWLKENLDVGIMVNGSQNQTNNGTIEKYCYDNDQANCNTYGGLYQWDEAMQYSTVQGAQGICPTGWHIPTSAEIDTLAAKVNNNGNALKAVGQGSDGGAGTNTSGFTALLGGYHTANGGHFYYLHQTGSFWTSYEINSTRSRSIDLYDDDSRIQKVYDYKDWGDGVRCLKD